MKNSDFLSLLLMMLITSVASSGAGQQLPSLKQTSFEQEGVRKVGMADFDEDDLLDLVLLSSSSPPMLSIHKNNGDDTFTEVATFPAFEEAELQILDFNLDNKPDIFVIGLAKEDSVGALMLSSKDLFEFSEETLSPGFSKLSSFCWMQYDQDSMPDLFISGDSVLTNEPTSMVLIRGENRYEAMETSFGKEIVNKIEAVPDPERLYYIQTAPEAESPTGLYKLSENGFKYIDLDIPDFESSTLAQGDLNHDGYWDLFLYGTDKEGMEQGGIYFRDYEHYTLFPLDLEVGVHMAYIQDLNNDGLAELLLLNHTEEGPQILTSSEAEEFQFNESSIVGDGLFITDYDKEGLPDFLILSEDKLSVYKPEGEEQNDFPRAPRMFMSLPMEEGLLFSWSEGSDDKTPAEALSYSLMLKDKSTGTIVKSSLINQKSFTDLSYGYGNLGLENMYHYEEQVGSSLDVTLTVFDNAHHTGIPSCLPVGVAGGEITIISPCQNTFQKDTTLCGPVAADLAKLFGFEAQYWVSYSRGYIGGFAALDSLREPEMFYGIRMDEGCLDVFYGRIDFADQEGLLTQVESCQGEPLLLNGREGNFTYNWFKGNGENIGREKDLEYVAEESEILLLENTSTITGCAITDTFQLEVFPYPQLELEQPSSMWDGGEVQLFARGADFYEWSPAEGLSDPHSASPVARPRQSTTYYVKAWIHEDCAVYDSVKVEIRKAFFVPSLFSPNGDGNNDKFAVNGSGVKDFLFRVYDSKGYVVWEARSPEEARNGWNGANNGKPLPPGNYAWEIRGMFEDGSLLHFENKKSGFITLIR